MSRKSATHRETEIKIRVPDMPALLDKLSALGIRPRGRVLEYNTLFDTENADLRNRGCLLRLRTETPAPNSSSPGGPERAILTAKFPAPADTEKGRLSAYKHALEREVVLPETPSRRSPSKRKLVDRGWAFALGCLGLHSKFRYEKYRTSFRADGANIDLDETPVGVFLELEGEPELIDRVARCLGYSPEDYIRSSYYGLYATEQRKKGRPVRHMLF